VIVAVEDMAENAPGTSHRNWNMEDPEALEPDVDWDTRLDWKTWLNFETGDFFQIIIPLLFQNRLCCALSEGSDKVLKRIDRSTLT